MNSDINPYKCPLYTHLQNYLTRDIYPFHMPGHKRNPEFLPPELIALDVTETEGMDNLHKPTGIIREFQKKIARIYGADESFFLVNGSSAGIVAAICAACNENTRLFTSRKAHQSIFHGIALSGARPVYAIHNSQFTIHNCGARPAYDDFERADAAIITRPEYSGKFSDIKKLADSVHRRCGVLIIDEAHGAHFPFSDAFPKTALSLGADIVINSFHKTLPAFSQTAALHVRGNRVDREKLRYYLRVLQTSSPSYMLMAATDFMLGKITDESWRFGEYVKNLTALRNSLPGSGNELAVTLQTSPLFEISKLSLILQTNMSGFEISKILADKYKVQMEMAVENSLLAMTSVADTAEGFSRLEYAVNDLNRTLPFIRRGEMQEDEPEIPEMVLTPGEAAKRETEIISVSEAAGRVSGDFYTKYPPGIPLLIPGEKISGETAERIEDKSIKVII